MHCYSGLAHDDSEKSDAQKKNGQDDGENENYFFQAALGAVNIALAAKRSRKAGTALLEQNRCNEQSRDDDLDHGQKRLHLENGVGQAEKEGREQERFKAADG